MTTKELKELVDVLQKENEELTEENEKLTAEVISARKSQAETEKMMCVRIYNILKTYYGFEPEEVVECRKVTEKLEKFKELICDQIERM